MFRQYRRTSVKQVGDDLKTKLGQYVFLFLQLKKYADCTSIGFEDFVFPRLTRVQWTEYNVYRTAARCK